jgi:hypothetical protein
MPFDQSVIASVSQPVYRDGQVFLKWTTTAPAGTYFQVYLDGVLAKTTTQTSAWIDPPADGVGRVDIGAIPASEAEAAASLPAAPARKARISWSGGTSLGASLVGFRVYRGLTAGAAVSYASPVATVAAFPGGATAASGSYSYTSGPLASGTWHFGVVPYDSAGNEGTPQETTVAISAPPGPPSDLAYTFHPSGTTPTVTLDWAASAG